MLDKPMVNSFAHIKPADTEWCSGGLRYFFLYRDLGIAEATGGGRSSRSWSRRMKLPRRARSGTATSPSFTSCSC